MHELCTCKPNECFLASTCIDTARLPWYTELQCIHVVYTHFSFICIYTFWVFLWQRYVYIRLLIAIWKEIKMRTVEIKFKTMNFTIASITKLVVYDWWLTHYWHINWQCPVGCKIFGRYVLRPTFYVFTFQSDA